RSWCARRHVASGSCELVCPPAPDLGVERDLSTEKAWGRGANCRHSRAKGDSKAPDPCARTPAPLRPLVSQKSSDHSNPDREFPGSPWTDYFTSGLTSP